MNLFDEVENKYYELSTFFLKSKIQYSYKDLMNMIESIIPGEMDFEVLEALFPNDTGRELVFINENGLLMPVLKYEFPIRFTTIEKQALKSLLSNKYKNSFLDKETQDKLQNVTDNIIQEWDPNQITEKNINNNNTSKDYSDYYNELFIISTAIRDKQMICYDNVREGRVNITKGKAYPIRIEYSVSNDIFRICAYLPEEYRFIKMNLDYMSNISLLDEYYFEDLNAKYIEFVRANYETVTLEVDPVNHAIERCFRIFSYFDRKAKYDKEENKYILKVSYFKADKNEIIKNILSVGSYAVVKEPQSIRSEVFARIIKARNNYLN